MTIGSGATFNDQTTSSGLNIFASNFGSTDTGATAVMNNQGTFTKSGSAATSTISTTFNNSGIVNVQSGTLVLSGSGTDVGASYTGTGTIQFSGGTRTLDAASSITAANATFSGGTTTINGTYNVAGTTTANGGTATLAGTLSSLGNALVISSGTLGLNTSSASVATLTQSGGLLNGSGTLTVSGLSTLSGVSNYSTESGPGTTIAQGGATFSESLFGLDGGRTLQLDGASTATGAGAAINLNNINPTTGSSDAGSGTLTIASGATFNDQTTGSGLTISAPSRGGTDTGVTAAVNNLGTFTKSGAAATSTISTLFNNSGIVNVTSGTLDLSGGGTDVGAIYEGSGTVQFGGGTRTLDATSSITGNALFSGGQTTVNGGAGTGLMTVTGGTATFNGTVTTSALTQSGGELNGSGTLTVTGLSTLSGVSNYSTESGPGTTIAQGGATFSESLFGLDGGRTLQLDGASTATGAGAAINLNNINPTTGSSDAGSGTLTIASGATFNDQTTGSGLTISAPSRGGTDTGVTAAVNNLGTFTKSGAATTSTISTLFNNSGIVNVTSGTLDLSGGGTDVGAIYEGSGTVQFGGGIRTLDATSSITGNALFSSGQTTVNGGAGTGLMTVTGGTATFNGTVTTSALTQSGGELNGSGTLTVTGLSTLSGVSNYSTESGPGTTIAQGGATFSESLFGLDGGRTLQLDGASTATGAGAAINLNNINPTTGSSDAGSGTLTIASGATFNDQTTGSGLTISAPSRGGTDTGVTAAVNNLGTFTKSGAATTSTISTLFNNSGIVNVTSGTLDLSGGGTDVGAIYEGSGTVQFGGGTRTLDATSSITGNALFSGGQTTVNGGAGTGLMTVTGGTATFNGTVTTSALTQSGGELNGSGTLTVTGLSTLSGVSNYSTESGPGTTIAQGGATFSESLFGLDGGRTLQLDGASTATGAGAAINLNNINPTTGSSDAGSGTLTIASGATFNDQTTGSGLTISAPSRGGTDTGVTAAVNNLGTFTKSGAATTSTISTLFNNSGIVNVTSGTLNLTGGGTISGTFNLAIGAIAQFNSAFTLNGIATFAGGTISGSGPLTIGNGANVEFSSSVSVPTISFSSGNGTLTLDNPSTFSSTNMIAGLVIGDTIDLRNTAVASATITGSTLKITETNNQMLSYQVSGAIAGNSFSVLSGATDSELVLVPSTAIQISGVIAAGSQSFTPTSTQLYQLTGALISGSGGNGFLVQSTDSISTDSIIVEIDRTSSISITGTGNNGLDLATGGASIFVFNAAPVSATHYGIGAFNSGSGNVTIANSGQVTSGSSGINASNQAIAILALANSAIAVSSSGTINSGTTVNASGSQPSGIVAGYLGGATSTPNTGVNGTVVVNNAANITAAAGWGIDAYNYGNGNVTVNDASGTTVTGAQYGIAAYAQSGGTGDVAINISSGDTINSGSSYGILGFQH